MIYFNGTTFTPHVYQATFTDNGEPRVQYGDDKRYWEEMVARWGHLEALRVSRIELTPEQQTRLDTLNGLTGINGLYTGDCADFVEHGIIRDDTDCPWLQPMIADYAAATEEYLYWLARKDARLSRAKFKLALLQAGFLDSVEAGYSEWPKDVQIMWDDSLEFERMHPTLLAFGVAMGFTGEQMDAIFGIVP